jgi:hypothetical protein
MLWLSISMTPRRRSSVLGHDIILHSFHLNERRPRGDSNAQPTDSKSGTLSIELRGQAHQLYRENGTGGDNDRKKIMG